jgi:hypothetical protein
MNEEAVDDDPHAGVHGYIHRNGPILARLIFSHEMVSENRTHLLLNALRIAYPSY